MGHSVLVCDDAIFMRTMVGDILQQAGFEIVGEAETGVQAVAMTHFGGLAVSTVVVTSTLARIAEALADRLAGRGRTNPAPGAHIGIWSMTWVCYLVGALTAGLAVKTPAWAMAVSAGLVAVAALVAARASAAATPARP